MLHQSFLPSGRWPELSSKNPKLTSPHSCCGRSPKPAHLGFRRKQKLLTSNLTTSIGHNSDRASQPRIFIDTNITIGPRFGTKIAVRSGTVQGIGEEPSVEKTRLQITLSSEMLPPEPGIRGITPTTSERTSRPRNRGGKMYDRKADSPGFAPAGQGACVSHSAPPGGRKECCQSARLGEQTDRHRHDQMHVDVPTY